MAEALLRAMAGSTGSRPRLGLRAPDRSFAAVAKQQPRGSWTDPEEELTESMEFEWDPDEAAANARKHGIAFTEAMTIFGDPLELTIVDPDHSHDELRFVSIGMGSSLRKVDTSA
jgi:hypothetical protein